MQACQSKNCAPKPCGCSAWRGAPPLKIDKEETIFDAALKIITNKGFHKARMSDIAKQAGISYGLIYNYFKHKRVDLLGASVNPGCLNFPVQASPPQISRRLLAWASWQKSMATKWSQEPNPLL